MALIVLAEDEFLLADMLVMALEDAGHEVVSAPHGAAALKYLQQTPADLIVSDFMMPLMTGLELAEAAKADPRLKDIPFLLMTGAQGHIAHAHPGLFDAILDKPCDLGDFLQTVETLLSKRQSRASND